MATDNVLPFVKMKMLSLGLLCVTSILVNFCDSSLDLTAEGADEMVPGRAVSVSGKAYRQAFKTSLVLGQCPLAMNGSSIATCSDSFVGEEVFIPRGSTKVSVTQVKSTDDVLKYVMGSIGTSVGVLGLASVNLKYKVAVTTQTSSSHLNLLSSYRTCRGVLGLRGPRPLTQGGGGGALFLSEIELGAEELFLVTVHFADWRQKVEAEASVVIKVLFVTVSAKLRYLHESMEAKASVRIQFQSSWRTDLDESFSHLEEEVLDRVQEVEQMFLDGPTLLEQLENDDERLHNVYYFSAWRKGPYERDFNEAVVMNDLTALTEQNAEIKAVIYKINELNKQVLESETRRDLKQLNDTLTEMADQIERGLDSYHLLSEGARSELRGVYGPDRAPLYYRRRLAEIAS